MIPGRAMLVEVLSSAACGQLPKPGMILRTSHLRVGASKRCPCRATAAASPWNLYPCPYLGPPPAPCRLSPADPSSALLGAAFHRVLGHVALGCRAGLLRGRLAWLKLARS